MRITLSTVIDRISNFFFFLFSLDKRVILHVVCNKLYYLGHKESILYEYTCRHLGFFGVFQGSMHYYTSVKELRGMHQLGSRHNSTDMNYDHVHPFRPSRDTNIDRPGFAFSYERKRAKRTYAGLSREEKGSSCSDIHRYSPPRIVKNPCHECAPFANVYVCASEASKHVNV